MDPTADVAVPEPKAAAVAKATVSDAEALVLLVKRGATQHEERHVLRALRSLARARKGLTAAQLAGLVRRYTPAAEHPALLALLPEQDATATAAAAPTEAAPMDESADATAATPATTSAPPASASPEAGLAVRLLLAAWALDQPGVPAGVAAAEQYAAYAEAQHRTLRVCGALAAKAYFFLARAHEVAGGAGAGAALRPRLHAALRAATLRQDAAAAATLLNALLRSLLADAQYAQADALLGKTALPARAPAAEAARHHYYVGRVRAVQLDYSVAAAHFALALRKAPAGAVGFAQAAHKHAVLVTLLLGEQPDRALFRTPALRGALAPYAALAAAVRSGQLQRFTTTLAEHAAALARDGTALLAARLRATVLRAGVRRVLRAYSRISLADLARRLRLDSAEDVRFLVAKAIRDGVVDATIDHAGGFVRAHPAADHYATLAPQDLLDQRIRFCLGVHTDATTAMRFPPNAYRKYLETAEQRREREDLERELEREIEDAIDEDDGGL